MSTPSRFIIMSIFAFTQSILSGHFSDIPQVEPQTEEAKLYVDPSDIVLSHEGIYWHYAGEQIPIQSVQVDCNGLSVIPIGREHRKYARYTCPGCKRDYAWYENCTTEGCSYNCKTPR